MARADETMKPGVEILSHLPSMKSATEVQLPHEITYVGAVGFEERALAGLRLLQDSNSAVDSVFLISYDPPSGPNRIDETMEIAESLSHGQPRMFTFRRFQSSSYLALKTLWQEVETSPGSIVIDISGMSKFLILAILWAARKSSREIYLLYFKAGVYRPTESEFAARVSEQEEILGPFVLEGGVPYVLTSPWLSSVQFDERPVFFVGFPSFDADLLNEPIEELAPESILLIEPGDDTEIWLREAFRQANRAIYDSSAFLRLSTETANVYDYRDVVGVLETLYDQFGLTHRIVVAPTGSKLQAVGTFIFKVIHPDIEIIYPAPIGHNPLSTEGVGPGFILELGPFSSLMQSLKALRKREILRLMEYFEHLPD